MKGRRTCPIHAVLALAWSLAAAAEPNDVLSARAEAGRLRARVETLTAPALAGRGAGTAGAAAAAETLSSWFAAAGLTPVHAGAWLQRFELSGQGWTGDPLAGRTGANVAALLPGVGQLAGRCLVVGAHLDHLGAVDPGAASAEMPEADAYYPGANDNASGVAIVHEIARRMAASVPGDAPRRAVLFVNFDAEEVGLQGAARFVDQPPVPLDSLDVMINLDTVGRLSDGRLIVSGLGTAAPLSDAVAAAARATGLSINPSRGGWSGSDHMMFNTREVPVLFLFGGPYPQYNRPTDTAGILDYEAMARVTAFSAALIDSLRVIPGRFVWQMVAGRTLPGEGADPVGSGANRQTWLGTMPDFTEGQTGYRLAGVFDDSPAAAAGLQKGDLLVRFGDFDVTDLATFTTALRAYSPGDLVEVAVERDGRDLHFTVALGDRAQRR